MLVYLLKTHLKFCIKLYLSSDFDETSPVNGLPMYQIEIPTEDIIASYPGVQFPGLAFLVTNFELEMTELDADGNNIVWDVTNAGATLSGPYMSSPFSMENYIQILNYFNSLIVKKELSFSET